MKFSLVVIAIVLTSLASDTRNAEVSLNLTNPVNVIEDFYGSFTLDYWYPNISLQPNAWINSSVITLDLTKPRLSYLAKTILRIGGTVADSIVYEFENPPVTYYKGNPYYCPGILCMTPKRFDEIIQFCNKTGIKLVYGVNGMGGRYQDKKSKWDYTNSFQLLKFIKEKHYVEDGLIYGLELGNELDYDITPQQQIEDFIIFKKEIERLWPNKDKRPKIIGPDTTTVKPEYIKPLIEKGLLDVITYHFYNTKGVDDEILKRIMTPSFLDIHINAAKSIVNVYIYKYLVKESKSPDMKIIMGEGAAACDSGHDNVTDRFVSSFYYVDDLAGLAQVGIKAQFRQAFVGGWYSLLERDESREPNSDYYVMKIWRDIVGKKILNTQSSDKMIRIYSQCSSEYSGGVVMEVLNLVNEVVNITSKDIHLRILKEKNIEADSLDGKRIYLNGVKLHLNEKGELPDLSGKDGKGSISVDGYSIV